MLTHEEIDANLNLAQTELFDELKPSYGVNQQLHDYLLPFESTLTLINGNTTGGLITLPADYSHLLSIELSVMNDSNVEYRNVELVKKDEAAERKNSQLIPASEYPFGYFKGKTIQLFPASPVAGTLFYLKNPAECEYVYTQVGRTITYDDVNSTQLEWDEEATKRIIFKALGLCGLNLVDMNAINFSVAKEGGK